MKNAEQKALAQAAGEKAESTIAAISSGYSDQWKFRGLVQAIPYAGGALDTWLSGPATEAQRKRIEKFIADTSAHFGDLDEKVLDKEFLKSEEFFLLFQQVLIRASRTHDLEKVELLSKAFTRAAINNVDSISRDSMIDLIDHLSPAHILVLRTLVANEPSAHYVTTDQASGHAIGGFMHASTEWIAQNHSELSDLPLDVICNDLSRFNLLNYEQVGSFRNDDDVIAGGARGYRPNSFGRSLVSFLDGTSNVQRASSENSQTQ